MEEAGFGKVQLPHKTPTPSSSAMQITTCSDASGRSVTFSSKKFHATALAGLLPIAHIARSLNLFKAAKEVLSDAVPSKRNTLYSPETFLTHDKCMTCSIIRCIERAGSVSATR